MPGSTPAPFASPAFKGRSRNGPWGDSVEELDWSTGRILDKLVELGIDKQTIVDKLLYGLATVGTAEDTGVVADDHIEP